MAALVSRNAVPIVGVLLLGWSAANLVVLYFLDFMLDLGTCFALMALFDPEARQAFASTGTVGKAKQLFGLVVAFVILAAIFGFVFGMPVFFMGGESSLADLFENERFRNGVLIHLALSSWTFLQVYRYLSWMKEQDAGFDVYRPVKGRYGYITARWLAVYATGLFVPMFPALMVAAYCVATVYIELFPKKVEEFLGPEEKEAPPRSR